VLSSGTGETPRIGAAGFGYAGSFDCVAAHLADDNFAQDDYPR